LELVIINN